MLMAVDITKHLEEMLGQPAKFPEPVEKATSWCLPVVRAGLEQEARDSLRRRGIGTWWPNYQRETFVVDRSTGNRMRRQMFAPMLPGILICAMPKNPDLDRVLWDAFDQIPGIISVMRRHNGDLVFLRDIDIVLLHKIEEGLNRSKPPKAERHAYEVGDKIRLVDDEYRSMPVAEVVESKRDSIEIAINFFGAVRRMMVRPFQIELVDSTQANRAKRGPARD